MTVCRGCCCGSVRKHPEVDHAGQVERLRAEVGAEHRVRVTDDCLDACERSNVVVVHPSPAGRAAGARPVWFGFVLDDPAVDEIAAWVRAGGPGVVPLPPVLELYSVPAPGPATRR
ncbi:hypothetical protein OG792_13615 [Micromonospora sp. NBC_01699]|uniref:hypothetical protein n=1 Tax=Micromonospora sp. NBC_01699 TaxID=2975984 RepID=UPI002E379683|nr:hypothetical protein [Micromonospora sp. NBC_01699]